MNALDNPAYFHILINHVPLIGLFFGLIALSVALFLKSRPAQTTALILILIAALSSIPTDRSGGNAYKMVRGFSDEAGADWLDIHADRADQAMPAFYVLAILTVAALIAPYKWEKGEMPLLGLVFVAAIVSLVLVTYVAQAGGKIRHPEFRQIEMFK